MTVVSGVVIDGKKIGGRLGFPTINIRYPQRLPGKAEGVYCSLVYIDGVAYAGVTHVGPIKTFLPVRYTCETYLLNVNRNLYTKKVTKNLIFKLRDVKRFSSAATLTQQIKKDVALATKFFGL